MDKTKKFIDRSNKIHNYEFDYSLTIFEKSTIKVKITCKKHGVFEQYPYNHLRGYKCPFCMVEKHKLNLDKAIESANKIHSNKYDYSLVYEQYERNKQKVFRVSMNNHISKKSGCPKCYYENKFLTTKEYVEKAIKLDIENNFDYSLVNYIDRDTKIDIICKKHGIIFNILPFHHLSANQGCKYCRLEKYKQTRIKNGNQIPDEKLTEWQIYRRKVVNITNRLRKNLFQTWNGYDFYDGEYIKENLFLPPKDKNYPTIDHKMSVYYGFINNIEPEEIANIENLCITKRKINSSKNKDNKF